MSLHFAEGSNNSVGSKLLVVAERNVVFRIEILQKSNARINLQIDVSGQPDFVVDPSLLDMNRRAFVDARQEEADRKCVDALDIDLHPLLLFLVDPKTHANFG